jgi:hypothetical protein
MGDVGGKQEAAFQGAAGEEGKSGGEPGADGLFAEFRGTAGASELID